MTKTEHLLIVLAEEAAEVVKEATKALRFGLDKIEDGQPKTNAERITDEVDDLLGTFKSLRWETLQVPNPSLQRQEEKRKKIENLLPKDLT